MENISCPVCHSADSSEWGTSGGATYVRCTQCRLVYENPRLTPDELREYYSKKSYFIQEHAGEETSGYHNYFSQCTPALVSEYFGILRQNVPGKTNVAFLDIGCGPGNLLLEATKHRWKAVGLEISHWAVETGRKAGLEIVEGSIESAQFETGSMDVISMFDVLEHLPSPGPSLAEVHRILRPGGSVVVETPNVEGFFVKHLYGSRSDMVKPRAHICLYSPDTIRRLFSAAGFSKIKVSTFPYCRRYSPGYLKGVAFSLLRLTQSPVQLTWNESLRISAWK